MGEAEFGINWSIPCTDSLGELRKKIKVMDRSLIENYAKRTGYNTKRMREKLNDGKRKINQEELNDE